MALFFYRQTWLIIWRATCPSRRITVKSVCSYVWACYIFYVVCAAVSTTSAILYYSFGKWFIIHVSAFWKESHQRMLMDIYVLSDKCILNSFTRFYKFAKFVYFVELILFPLIKCIMFKYLEDLKVSVVMRNIFCEYFMTYVFIFHILFD